MVYFLGILSEAHSVKPGQLVEMFESSWRVRNIWDGVKLEVVEDRSPVVLHSFTHLDPDLPLLEVRSREEDAVMGHTGVMRRGEGSELDLLLLQGWGSFWTVALQNTPYVSTYTYACMLLLFSFNI